MAESSDDSMAGEASADPVSAPSACSANIVQGKLAREGLTVRVALVETSAELGGTCGGAEATAATSSSSECESSGPTPTGVEAAGSKFDE